MARSHSSSSSTPSGTPRDVAKFLVDLKPILSAATEARRNWVRRIGILMEDARRGNEAALAASASSIGRDYVNIFRSARDRVDRLSPPRGCSECHRSLQRWLDKLVAACELLIEVGISGNVARIRETQGILAEGRVYAQKFNEEYATLIKELRERVATLAARQRERKKTRVRRARDDDEDDE